MPEAAPAPIVFVAETDERPQLDVYTISFDNNPDGTIKSADAATDTITTGSTDSGQLDLETLFKAGQEAVAGKMDLKAAMAHTRKSMDPIFGHVFIYEHCLPFDVTRAYDEASGIKHPRIWTAERDKAMWAALQA